ncbi:ATP-binding protein [Sphaerisporangium rubeum]|uniref:Uncharacterized protein n=1 Tax=Sphaerisporangium rubeum TaxID=321317 RepID=A0A7X0IE01_9ACTN|nr:ATP-binding protein [Sphaerisporangium rubeum]MBB6473275.1 hypothetical protein [Sphaerisporangium rubeum]
MLALVERILGGTPVEDSQVECKADWPKVEKARQLAGHANSAHGEPIMWIIGVDEKKQCLTKRDPSVDAATWWNQFQARFDEGIAPDLTNTQVVPIDEENSVVALVFETDRAPYVIKVSNMGSVERDVPVRKGTGTRSANRSDLIKILMPAQKLPDVSMVEAEGSAHLVPARDSQPEHLRLIFRSSVFLYQPVGGVAVLPAHQMRATIEFRQKDISAAPVKLPARLLYFGMTREERASQPRFGVLGYPDAAFVVGAGGLTLHIQKDVNPREFVMVIQDCPEVVLSYALSVSGATRPLAVSVSLMRANPRASSNNIARWLLRGDQY